MSLDRTYFPAAGWHWLLPVYDPWLKLLGADKARGTLLEQMGLAPGLRVLDIGCGTGTLAVQLKQLNPDLTVMGLDPDPRALARAAAKARRAGVEVRFDRGFSDQVPYADASFDRVSCTFMFSLLSADEKRATLRQVRRVLTLGGSFHLLDLVQQPPGGLLARLLQPGQRFEVCSEEQILTLMRQAGLLKPRTTRRFALSLWPLASYEALAA